jgi:hypothetical protein
MDLRSAFIAGDLLTSAIWLLRKAEAMACSRYFEFSLKLRVPEYVGYLLTG